jgi:hypothetical protein
MESKSEKGHAASEAAGGGGKQKMAAQGVAKTVF